MTSRPNRFAARSAWASELSELLAVLVWVWALAGIAVKLKPSATTVVQMDVSRNVFINYLLLFSNFGGPDRRRNGVLCSLAEQESLRTNTKAQTGVACTKWLGLAVITPCANLSEARGKAIANHLRSYPQE